MWSFIRLLTSHCKYIPESVANFSEIKCVFHTLTLWISKQILSVSCLVKYMDWSFNTSVVSQLHLLPKISCCWSLWGHLWGSRCFQWEIIRRDVIIFIFQIHYWWAHPIFSSWTLPCKDLGMSIFLRQLKLFILIFIL